MLYTYPDYLLHQSALEYLAVPAFPAPLVHLEYLEAQQLLNLRQLLLAVLAVLYYPVHLAVPLPLSLLRLLPEGLEDLANPSHPESQ
jgi:hypothetical protein